MKSKLSTILIFTGSMFCSLIANGQENPMTLAIAQLATGNSYFKQAMIYFNAGLSNLDRGAPGTAARNFVSAQSKFSLAFEAYGIAGGNYIGYAASLGMDPSELGSFNNTATKYRATGVFIATADSAYRTAYLKATGSLPAESSLPSSNLGAVENGLAWYDTISSYSYAFNSDSLDVSFYSSDSVTDVGIVGETIPSSRFTFSEPTDMPSLRRLKNWGNLDRSSTRLIQKRDISWYYF